MIAGTVCPNYRLRAHITKLVNDRGDQVVFETTYVRFLTFLRFVNPKKHDFYVFRVTAHVFANTAGDA